MHDHRHLYDSPDDYFAFGDSVMVLSPTAALIICEQAATNGRVIARIEGGYWHESNRFQPRIDMIWDGADPPISAEAAQSNNLLAAGFIQANTPPLSAFVFTSSPLTGWPQRVPSGAL
ncbi:MAG: colicin immunity protein [Sphingobacteriales bacterium]|nr:MAG: colicin immunity protein [Sphingobacteriales bacterium]